MVCLRSECGFPFTHSLEGSGAGIYPENSDVIISMQRDLQVGTRPLTHARILEQHELERQPLVGLLELPAERPQLMFLELTLEGPAGTQLQVQALEATRILGGN